MRWEFHTFTDRSSSSGDLLSSAAVVKKEVFRPRIYLTDTFASPGRCGMQFFLALPPDSLFPGPGRSFSL